MGLDSEGLYLIMSDVCVGFLSLNPSFCCVNT